jgi:hypothetical protein
MNLYKFIIEKKKRNSENSKVEGITKYLWNLEEIKFKESYQFTHACILEDLSWVI